MDGLTAHLRKVAGCQPIVWKVLYAFESSIRSGDVEAVEYHGAQLSCSV